MGGSASSSRSAQKSAVCAVCLGPVIEQGLPTLDCQHRFCLRCTKRFSGKAVLKGTKFPKLSQCPVCSELLSFVDSGTSEEPNESITEDRVTPVKSYSVENDVQSGKPIQQASSRKRQHDYVSASNDSDEDFLDATEDSGRSSDVSDVRQHILCHMCKMRKPKRKKSQGTVYCFDCAAVLCAACKTNHEHRPRCRGHVICPVTMETITDLLCRTHEQLAEDYCVDCKSVTCAECHMTEHQNHNIQSFTTSDLDQSLFMELEKCMAKNQATLESIDVMEKVYSTEIANTKQSLEKSQNEIIDAVHCQFDSMHCTLADEESTTKEHFDEVRRSVKEHDVVLNNLLQKGKKLVTPIGSIQELHISNASELLAELREKIPRTKHTIQQPNTYVFIPVEELKTSWGQLVKVPLGEIEKCIELE